MKQLQLNNTADRWEVLDSFDAPFFQGAAYPNGAYVLALQPVSDGNKTLTLALSGNYASIPFILNFNALQAVVASNDFNVTWAIPGGTINDFVQLQILQVDSTGFISEIFNSGQPGDVGALNGTTTSASLPADTLSHGTIYSGRLLVGTR